MKKEKLCNMVKSPFGQNNIGACKDNDYDYARGADKKGHVGQITSQI